MPIQAEIADLLKRTPRPRSLGGRRLKAGSEVNSLREKAIKAEGSRRGATRSQTTFKEPAIKAEEGANRILLPTRIPQHKHMISMRQKPHRSSPAMMMSTGSHLEPPAMNPDSEEDEDEEELTTILPVDIFDGQY